MKKSILKFSLCAFSILALSVNFSSCKKSGSEKTAQKDKISVVVTTFPCYDAVRAVSGDFLNSKVNLKLLVKPGMEVHSFDPAPADIVSIQKSDLFVYVGGESDEWVEKILKNTSDELNCQTVELIHFVNTLDEPEFDEDFEEGEATEESGSAHHHEHDESDEHEAAHHDHHHHEAEHHENEDHDEHEHHEGHHHHHEHAENVHEQDEHIWTSPENELIIVRAVCTYLQQIAEKKGLSELSAQFEKNAEDYCSKIEQVAQKTAEIIASKSEKFLLMADRFPFTYYVNYYGLEFDAAFSGCSTAVEASTATISRLIDTVNEKQLPAVFYIELGNHKIADSISESTKTKALLLESCQNVTKTNFQNGETWVTLMDKNAETLNIGLK